MLSYIELFERASNSFWLLMRASDAIDDCIEQLKGTKYSNVVDILKKIQIDVDDASSFPQELLPCYEVDQDNYPCYEDDQDNYKRDIELKKLMHALQNYFDKEYIDDSTKEKKNVYR